MPVCVWGCVCAFLRMCVVLGCRKTCICIAVQRTCTHTPVSRQVCVLDFRGSLAVERLRSSDYSPAEKARARQRLCQNCSFRCTRGQNNGPLCRKYCSGAYSLTKRAHARNHAKDITDARSCPPQNLRASTCTVPCPHPHPSHRSHPSTHTRPFQNQPWNVPEFAQG
jgi:hypothetical protein